MKLNITSTLFLLITCIVAIPALAVDQNPAPFVMQLTRTGDSFGHLRAMMQINAVLNTIGEKNLKIEVVAYEDGIHALLDNDSKTAVLMSRLADRGVTFKACQISMRAWNLNEGDFPVEVEFVSAGAPEVIKLQMKGYKYWRP